MPKASEVCVFACSPNDAVSEFVSIACRTIPTQSELVHSNLFVNKSSHWLFE
jgi:hypothetical protein